MEQEVSITVVVIAKNEEENIADCLKSVKWADEMIVLDDYSTDDTPSIARELGARVIQRKMDIEGKHRNFGYAQAKNAWVLSLDADREKREAMVYKFAYKQDGQASRRVVDEIEKLLAERVR